MHWTDFHWTLPDGPALVRGLSLLALFLCLGISSVAAQSPSDTSLIYVRLQHQSTINSVDLTVEEGELEVLLPSGGPPVERLQPGETATFGLRQSDVSFQQSQSGLYAQSLTVEPVREGSWSLSTGNRESSTTYKGGLRLTSDGANRSLVLINKVPLTDYVASVVASEYGLDDREGAKAMAIVARTYALFSSKGFDGEYDHVDGTASQVYAGADAVTDAARRAAQETRGQILTHDGDPIQAVYFSSSGGHTANNEDVWKSEEALPYLRGKNDPYDDVSPHHRWTARVDRTDLLRILTRHQGASVEGFLVDDRSQEGRVATIELLMSNGPRTQMRANDFRLVVNEGLDENPLKSTWFDAKRSGDTYVFEGRGFGHGVGFNQWGAHAMAQEGKSYREILSFYYTGVDIERLEGAPFAPPDTPVAEESEPEDDSTTRRVGW